MVECEVGRLQQHIEQACLAFRHSLYHLLQTEGFNALHQRYSVLDEHYEALAALVGDKEACAIFLDEYVQVILYHS